jgi:hypothetical protein
MTDRPTLIDKEKLRRDLQRAGHLKGPTHNRLYLGGPRPQPSSPQWERHALDQIALRVPLLGLVRACRRRRR